MCGGVSYSHLPKILAFVGVREPDLNQVDLTCGGGEREGESEGPLASDKSTSHGTMRNDYFGAKRKQIHV